MGMSDKMKIRQENNRSIKRKFSTPIQVYLAYMLLCTMLLTAVSFSRYRVSGNADDVARVAAGVVEVTYDDNTNISLVRPSNDGTLVEDFNFEVSNKNSEVAIGYDVVVQLDQALKDGVTMTLDGQTVTAEADNTYTFSSMGTFTAGVSETKEHTLSFAGDFDTIKPGTDDTYNITISIRSQQID